MIADFFLNFPYYFISWIISIFPVSAGFPPEVISSAQTIGGYVGIFNPIISVPTLAAVLTIVFTVELAIFAFKSFKWIISHIPYIGGRG